MSDWDGVRAAAVKLREVGAASLAASVEQFAEIYDPSAAAENPLLAALRAVAEASTPEELAAAQAAAAALVAGA